MPAEALRGACFCGAARYELRAEPLTLYACHCTDCQTASGASFTLTLSSRPTASRPSRARCRRSIGRARAAASRRSSAARAARRHRGECVPIGPRSGPSVRERSSRARPSPIAHIWIRSTQPSIRIPDGALRYEQQPADMLERVRASQAHPR